MNDMFVDTIKSCEEYKEFDYNKIVTSDYAKSKYPHLTFRVDDITDYLKIVALLSKTINGDSFVNREIIYRGMANEEWVLKPTLGRYKNIEDDLEYNLVNRFLNLAPSEFAELNSSFELLSKMQHYGLPTRLLDFSSNPLIALFFACSDEKYDNKNARILCHRAYVRIAQDELPEMVCGIYKNRSIDDMFLDDLEISPFRYLHDLYRIQSDRIIVARPAVWNKRIQNQQAVFMIFPNKISDCYGRWAYGGENDYPHIWEQERFSSSLNTVKNEPLNEIYPNAEQGDFYINHDTITKLFEYYDNDFSILEKWSEPFRRRFCFEAELELIDDYTLKNEFCSIIVEKQYKKKLLNQLEQIGIDKSFVYPELQYVAEKVKNMYVNKDC